MKDFKPYFDLLVTGDTMLYNIEEWKTQKFYTSIPPFDEINK
jgi:hypothetical protein